MSIQRWNFFGIEDDSGQIVRYDNHLAEMQRVKDALELQLADARKASEWHRVTPENLPKKNDVFFHKYKWITFVVLDDWKDILYPGWFINPPEPSNPTRHGHCPACANGQCLERGEGTHHEGTIEHPEDKQ